MRNRNIWFCLTNKFRYRYWQYNYKYNFSLQLQLQLGLHYDSPHLRRCVSKWDTPLHRFRKA